MYIVKIEGQAKCSWLKDVSVAYRSTVRLLFICSLMPEVVTSVIPHTIQFSGKNYIPSDCLGREVIFMERVTTGHFRIAFNHYEGEATCKAFT